MSSLRTTSARPSTSGGDARVVGRPGEMVGRPHVVEEEHAHLAVRMRPLSGYLVVQDVVERRDAVAGDEQQVVVVDAVGAREPVAAGHDAGSRTELGASGQPSGRSVLGSIGMTSRLRAIRHHARPAPRAVVQRLRRRRLDRPSGCWSASPCTRPCASIADLAVTWKAGANGIAGNLDSAGDSAGKVPLIGDALSSPLDGRGVVSPATSRARRHQLNTTASWLAWLLASPSPLRRSWRSRCRGWCCGCGSSGASGWR